MTSPPGASETDERVRLFCALRLPDEALDRLVAWQRRDPAAPGPRRPAREPPRHARVPRPPTRRRGGAIADELRAAAAGDEPELLPPRATARRGASACSSAPTRRARARSPRRCTARLARLGVYEPERREWLPHVTVARFRERPRLRLRAAGSRAGRAVRPCCLPVPSAPRQGRGTRFSQKSARRSIEVDREQALDVALGQIERQFGKGRSCG